MTLQNVEKIEAQEKYKKSWFQKFRGKLALPVVAIGGMAAASAHADVPDFLATGTTALGGIATGLGTLFVAAIGISLLVMAFMTSKGGIKKAGT